MGFKLIKLNKKKYGMKLLAKHKKDVSRKSGVKIKDVRGGSNRK